MPNRLFDILAEVCKEVERAQQKHPTPMRSGHEGYAILKEEVDELWAEIKADRDDELTRKEAVQVAAMAVRFLHDLFR